MGTALMGSQRVYSQPVATNAMSSASPTTLTYGAAATGMSTMPYQVLGQSTTSSPMVTYPASFQAYPTAPSSMVYQAPTVYQSPMTYPAPINYTASSYVQTGMSPVGATFDMLDQNHDGVITKQEFSAVEQ